MSDTLHLELPATSANLGPGFDALGLALALKLTIDAAEASAFTIDASGRNPDLCGALSNNLILETYKDVLAKAGHPVKPLNLRLVNRIPLGMGLGSSAAALVAGTMLANHFGELGWRPEQVLFEACRREGHPDNVAACMLGGLTASKMEARSVTTATCGGALPWKVLVALPRVSLATEKARALLPDTYSREDTVANIQSTALLTLAFALGRPDLLESAMRDRVHQPYRAEVCPLLPKLLPLAGLQGVYGVALSGAGPSVLVLCDAEAPSGYMLGNLRKAAGDPDLEILQTSIGPGAVARVMEGT